MAKKNLAPTDQVLNSKELPVGRVATPGPQRGVVKKKGGAKGFAEAATAVPRRQIQERMGARRRVEVSLPGPESPEASHTQANGRIIPGGGKQTDSFWAGTGDY